MRFLSHYLVRGFLVLAVAAPVFAATFIDDFSSMPIDTCYTDGATAGAWRSIFDGYGCNATIFALTCGSSGGGSSALRAARPMCPTAKPMTINTIPRIKKLVRT